MQERHARTLCRIAAFVLAFGGLLGALGSAVEGVHFLRIQKTSRSVGDLLSLVLYLIAIYAGVALWKSRTGNAIRLGIIFFVLQIPILSWQGFVYTFSTLLNLRLVFGDVNRHLLADIGSSSNIYHAPGQTVWMVGINFVGIAGAWYLIWVQARTKRHLI